MEGCMDAVVPGHVRRRVLRIGEVIDPSMASSAITASSEVVEARSNVNVTDPPTSDVERTVCPLTRLAAHFLDTKAFRDPTRGTAGELRLERPDRHADFKARRVVTLQSPRKN